MEEISSTNIGENKPVAVRFLEVHLGSILAKNV